MKVTGQQYRDFCDGAIEFLRGGPPPGDWLWLLLESGDTIVVPGTDYEHYDDHSEWPLLLMTGPDPELLLRWWLPDPGVGGDEFVEAIAVAREKARTATDAEWLALCQRVVDEQFMPMAHAFTEPTPESEAS